MTESQELLFAHKSFLFLAAVAIVKLEIYGSKFIAYLIVIIMLSQLEIIFPKWIVLVFIESWLRDQLLWKAYLKRR